ncbi:MAG: regulatory protein RecX [Candidatus Omnitrophota bacterium]
MLRKRRRNQAKIRSLEKNKEMFETAAPDPLSRLSSVALAKRDALRLLRFRPRSVKEISLRLKQKRHSDLVIAEIIEELKGKNFLNDDIFAKLWINERLSLKPSGRALLAQELRTKGIDDAVIEKAFSGLKGSFDESGIAVSLARKRMERFRNIDEQKAKKKLFDFLRRRGFSDEIVWKTLKDIYGVADA